MARKSKEEIEKSINPFGWSWIRACAEFKLTRDKKEWIQKNHSDKKMSEKEWAELLRVNKLID